MSRLNKPIIEDLKVRGQQLQKKPSDTLKDANAFRKQLEEPVEEGLVVVISKGKVDEGSIVRMLLDQFLQIDHSKYHIVWQLPSEKAIEKLGDVYDGQVQYSSYKKEELAILLAKAQIIVSDNILPAYYARREGQRYCFVGTHNWYDKMEEKTALSVEGQRLYVRDLLHANVLLSFSKEMTKEFYGEHMKLANIYDGDILEIGDLSRDSMEILVDYLFLQGEKSKAFVTNIPNTASGKTLFVADYRKDQWWQKNFNDVILSGKYKDLDLTIVTPVVKESWQLHKLEELTKDCRILMKTGYMGTLDDEFLSYYVLEKGWLTKDAKEITGHNISEDTMEYEWKRLVGTSKFDQIVMCDREPMEQFGLWDAMTRSSKCQDVIYESQNSLLSDIMEKAWEQEISTCVYEEDSYMILSQWREGQQMDGILCKEIEEGINYLCRYTGENEDDAEKLLRQFAKKSEGRLYVIDEKNYWPEQMRTIAKELELDEKVIVLSGVFLSKVLAKRCQYYISLQEDDPYREKIEALGLEKVSLNNML